jgi:Xaa-Pro aminopeptidase
VAEPHEKLTRCFEAKVGAWFGGEGRRTVADRARLRQLNMALALALSRWLEWAPDPDAPERMRSWLDEVERRAVRRGADARADAVRLARRWLDECG